MTIRLLASDETVARSRGEQAICVVLSEEEDRAVETLVGVISYTPSHVPILVACASGERLRSLGAGLDGQLAEDRELLALPEAAGLGFASAVNAASAVAGSGDLAVVARGVSVGPGWLERLRDAAHSDSTVVTATALDDGAGPVGVRLGAPPIDPAALAQPAAALAVSAHSQCVYPRIAVAGAECVYLRRELFDRAGGLSLSVSDPRAAVAELSLRALSLGMLHVAADDVYVTGVRAHPAIGVELLEGETGDEPTVLRRSLGCARAALRGIFVTIDARSLGPGMGGTQIYTSELIRALAANGRVRVRAVVPPDLPAALARRFEDTPELQVITYEQAAAGVELSDVVHRPQQVFSEDDLTLLRMLGERVVIGQQDLIAYRNPAYHETADRWQSYRRVTRLALTVADRVVFFSEHARRDAMSEDLVAPERGDVGGIGADMPSPGPVTPAAPGAATDLLDERGVLLCIGADYKHKNRPFAIELLQALRQRHGWEGCLVFAGSHVSHGSSAEEERALFECHPELRAAVIDMGSVSEAEKAWLYERACAVIYPTLYEGFGLVPFEAARAGRPCLYAPQASLLDLAGSEAATLTPWDASLSSDTVAPLLREGTARERHLRLLADGIARYRWKEVVERLLETYERAIQAPYRAAAPRAWRELQREKLITDLAASAAANNRAYNELRESVGIGLHLVAEDGLLSRDEQRGLLRVASREPLHRVILGPLGVLGRIRRQPAATGDLGSGGAAATNDLGSAGTGGDTGEKQAPADDPGTRW